MLSSASHVQHSDAASLLAVDPMPTSTPPRTSPRPSGISQQLRRVFWAKSPEPENDDASDTVPAPCDPHDVPTVRP